MGSHKFGSPPLTLVLSLFFVPGMGSRGFLARWIMRARVEAAKRPRAAALVVVGAIATTVLVAALVFGPSLSRYQRRAKQHAKRRDFYRLYEVGVDVLDKMAHPHETRPVVVYNLRERSDPATFGAPSMVLHHPSIRHMKLDDECAPGYENIAELSGRDLLLARLIIRLPMGDAVAGDAESVTVPNECVRSLGGDVRLLDAERDGCSQPFELSCGGWRNYISHHVGGAGIQGEFHRLNELGPEEFHLALTDVFDEALRDSESLVARVLAAQISVQPAESDGDSGLGMPLIPNVELDFTGCAMLALVRTDALSPVVSMCDNVWPGCYEQVVDHIEQLEMQVLTSGLNCSSLLLTRGALGDGGIIQLDMHGRRQVLDSSVSLDAARYLSRLLAPFGAYYEGLDADSTIMRAPGVLLRRVRLALPVGSDSPFGEAHRMRILRLALSETLQDRFAHYVMADIPPDVVRALVANAANCIMATDLERVVHMVVPDPDERIEGVECLRSALAARTIGWTSLAPRAQHCWRSRRIRPNSPMFDLHVPAMGVDDVALLFTPAMLQTPWYSRTMEPSETIARFYFPLVRAAVEAFESARRGPGDALTCSHVIEGSQRALRALTECFSTHLLKRSFWVQLMQNFCDHPRAAVELPLSTPHHTEGSALWLRLASKCEGIDMDAAWRETVTEMPFFRRAFSCPRRLTR